MRPLGLAAACSAVALAAGAAVAQSPAPADWKTFRYPEEHVTFRGPPDAKPTLQKAFVDIPDSPGVKATDDHFVVVDKGHWAFMVGISDWSGNTHVMNIDGVPAGAVKGMDMTFDGPVRTVAYAGGAAREYDAHKGSLMVRGRAIIVGRVLVQAMALSDTGSLPPNTDAFLGSVNPLP